MIVDFIHERIRVTAEQLNAMMGEGSFGNLTASEKMDMKALVLEMTMWADAVYEMEVPVRPFIPQLVVIEGGKA